MRIALQTQQSCHLLKFSPTIPTTRDFQGPPVTPIDPTTGYIKLPIPPLPRNPSPPQHGKYFSTLQSQFRAELQSWKRPLYGSIRKAGATNTLYTILSAKQTVMIVSDASVQKNGQSRFAWLVAHGSDILWRGLGLAPGPHDDTYLGRAEAYGLLAAIGFLRFYLHCYENKVPSQLLPCYCDNSGVITNLTSMRECVVKRPNDTTNDDYDLYAEITATAAQCRPIRLQYIHVKGHQDTNKNQQLTTEALHNIDCDNAAKKYVRTCNLQSTTLQTPALEAAQPHLFSDGKILCRQIIPRLRQAAAAPEYWKYLRERYNWTQADLNGIQWNVLELAINSLPVNDQRRLRLFIHDKLPLRTSKFHPHRGSQICPSCSRNPEDKGHFLQCQHPERRQLFEKLKANLTTLSTKHNLHPSIFTAYWLGLVSTRNATAYPNDTTELPQVLQTAIHYQKRLGWSQLFHGRLTKYWTSAIDQLNPHIAASSTQIMTKLLQTIWAYILATWSLRNRHLHNNAGQMSMPDYRQAVCTLYERRDQLDPEAQAALFR